MSERVVKVTVTAVVASYLDGMDKVSKAAREGRSDAEKLTAQLEAQRKAFTVVGTSMVAAGGLIAAGLILATKRAADFEQAMSEVSATGADAKANISGLREAALEAGADTVYSARQAAGAIEELSKAGITAKDVIGGGLTGALNLAASGGIDVAEAAETMADTLNQFKLEGRDATHVADLLAAGAGKASGGVGDLGMALKQVGQVASATGLSVEETTAGLAAFASAGLKGSDAGTSFKTMLGALTPNSQKAADEMKRLGINAFDSQGNFIGLQKFAGQLQQQLAGLTNEQRQASLEIMFGSDAVRAGIELYNQGADGIREWIKAVDDQGFAAKQASERLDNLNGDLEKLGGAFDTLLIGLGESGQGPLRSIVQGVTELVDGFNDMPEGGQAAVFWLGAVGSAALIAGGTFFISVPKVAAFNAALAEMGPNAQRAGKVLGAIGKGAGIVAGLTVAIVAATTALVEYAREVRGTDDAVAAAWTTNRGFLQSMEDLGVVTEGSAKATKRALDALADGNVFGTVGIDIASLRDGLTDLQSGLDGLPIETAVSRFQAWSKELNLTERQQKTLLDEMPELKDKIREHLTVTGDAADKQSVFEFATRKSADAVQGMADKAAVAEQNLTDMKDALDGVSDTALTMSGAVDAAQGSLNDLVEAAKAEGVTLDGANDVSIAFRDTMRDVEQSHRDAAEAILQNGGTLEDATGKYYEGRNAVIEMLKAKGLDQAAAERWADTNLGSAGEVVSAMSDVKRSVDNIPAKKTITLVADTAPAMATVNEFVRTQDGRRINFYVDGYVGRKVAGSNLLDVARADGGIIPGRPSRTDNMIAAVASGEFIVNSAQTARYRAELEAINSGRFPHYANGGYVQPQYASSHGGGGGWSGGAAPVFNMTINALPGMSVSDIADEVIRKAERKLR